MVVIQETASQVLLDTIRVAKAEKDSELVHLALDDCIQLFLIIKSCNLTLFKLVTFLLVQVKFEKIASYLYKLTEKLFMVLDSDLSQGPKADYKLNVEICEFFRILGIKLIESKNRFIGIQIELIIKRIDLLCYNRITRVQLAARRAAKIWKRLRNVYQSEDLKKMEIKYDLKNEDELLALRLEQDSLESRSERSEEEDSLEKGYNKQNSIARGLACYKKNNLVEKTYLKQRALNYVKKGSGTGGGFISGLHRGMKSKEKPAFNQIRDELRNQIIYEKRGGKKKIKRENFINRKKSEVVKEKIQEISEADLESSEQSSEESVSSQEEEEEEEESAVEEVGFLIEKLEIGNERGVKRNSAKEKKKFSTINIEEESSQNDINKNTKPNIPLEKSVKNSISENEEKIRKSLKSDKGTIKEKSKKSEEKINSSSEKSSSNKKKQSSNKNIIYIEETEEEEEETEEEQKQQSQSDPEDLTNTNQLDEIQEELLEETKKLSNSKSQFLDQQSNLQKFDNNLPIKYTQNYSVPAPNQLSSSYIKTQPYQ